MREETPDAQGTDEAIATVRAPRPPLGGLALLAALFAGAWMGLPGRPARPYREHPAVYGMNGAGPVARRRRQIATGMLRPNGGPWPNGR